MTVVATKARGAKVEIGDALVGPFVEIKGITSGPSWEGFQQQILEVWPHDQATPTKLQTGTQLGKMTFGGNFDSGDTTGQLALQSAAAAGTMKYFKVTLADTGAEIIAFPAFVDFSIDANPDGVNQFSASLAMYSAPTIC